MMGIPIEPADSFPVQSYGCEPIHLQIPRGWMLMMGAILKCEKCGDRHCPGVSFADPKTDTVASVCTECLYVAAELALA